MKTIRFFCAVEPGIPMLRDLLPYLAQNGAEVQLIITRQEYRVGREALAPMLRASGVSVRTVWVPFSGGAAGAAGATGATAAGAAGARKLNVYVAFVASAMLRSLFGKGVDLNVFLTQPPLFYVWGCVLKAVRRQPYAVIVMDVYPDVAVKSGMLRGTGVVAGGLTFLARLGLRSARHVVAIGHCMRELLERKYVSPGVTSVIPNWADDRTVFPVPHSENGLRAELGFGAEHFLVVYSGNMGEVHYFDDVLEVARRLRNHPSIRFVFIGDGSRRREVERARERDNLTNLMLLPFQPASRMAESLSMGDIHFVSLRAGFEGLVVPSKTYGPLAAGRPVIYQGDDAGEIARTLPETGAGRVVPIGDPDALEQCIIGLFNDPAAREAAGAAALGYARSALSNQQCIQSYGAVLCG
ncbi:MAG TPA: glycosyltransferase family 4 protein [Gemmatimonadaceae bacterium]